MIMMMIMMMIIIITMCVFVRVAQYSCVHD